MTTTQKFQIGPFADGSAQELDVQYGAAPVPTSAPHTYGKPGGPQITAALGAITHPQPPPPPDGPSPIVLKAGMNPITFYKTSLRDWLFNGSQLPAEWDAGLWNYGSEAVQMQPSQVSFDGSEMRFTAIKKTGSQGLPFMSGWADTKQHFSHLYGRTDFTGRFPLGQGLWPAYWHLSPQGSGEELDDLEALMGHAGTAYGSLHAKVGGWSETQSGQIVPDAASADHTYTTIWEPTQVTWAINGAAYAQYTKAQAGGNWTFDQPMSLIASLGVSGAQEWGGPPDAATLTLLEGAGAVMTTKRIRVWQ